MVRSHDPARDPGVAARRWARMRIALTRGVSPAIVRCELSHLARQPIDVVRAEAQHAGYESALREAGCEVRRIATEPDMPDAVFVEDTAIVLDELAIITRPGAVSRRAETDTVAEALRPLRPLVRLQPPATLDGGDVMRTGRTLYVGRSARTNDHGIAQLTAVLAPYGYRVVMVAVTGCLHLKSAVTPVGEGMVLVQPAWVDPAAFDAALERIEVDPGEAFGANALRIAERVIVADGFPRTRRRLEQRGLDVHAVALSELAKAEGAVTCCSLIVDAG
jgi:dimethylargininase